MSDSKDQNQKEKDNLARIRENQRRSRARRKEYLSELETRWRACEQIGVEATSEVQGAARQVLDENKRLRALLRRKGVSDAEIDEFEFKSTSSGATYETIPASLALETMLRERKPCKPSECGSSCSSATVKNASPSPSINIQEVPQVLPHTPLAHQQPQAFSLEGTAFTLPQSAWSGSLHPQSLMPSNASTPQPLAIGSHHGQPIDFPDNFGLAANWAEDLAIAATTAATTAASTCSCIDAASIIRNMHGDIGPDLEAQLGCPHAHANCRVNNSLAFDVMERYSHGGLGP